MSETTEIKLLNVGDVLYTYGSWNTMGKHVIDRVTEKRAFSQTNQFHREVKTISKYDGSHKEEVKIVGSYGCGHLETPELKKEYDTRQVYARALSLNSHLSITKLTPEQCQQYIDLLTSFKTTK